MLTCACTVYDNTSHKIDRKHKIFFLDQMLSKNQNTDQTRHLDNFELYRPTYFKSENLKKNRLCTWQGVTKSP